MSNPNNSYGSAYTMTGYAPPSNGEKSVNFRAQADHVNTTAHNELLRRKTKTTGSYTVVSKLV